MILRHDFYLLLTLLEKMGAALEGLLPKLVLPARQSNRGWKAAPTGRDAKETSVGEASASISITE